MTSTRLVPIIAAIAVMLGVGVQCGTSEEPDAGSDAATDAGDAGATDAGVFEAGGGGGRSLGATSRARRHPAHRLLRRRGGGRLHGCGAVYVPGLPRGLRLGAAVLL